MKLWKKPRLAAALCAVVVLVCAAAPAVFLSVVDAAQPGAQPGRGRPLHGTHPHGGRLLPAAAAQRPAADPKQIHLPARRYRQERKPLIYYNNQANDLTRYDKRLGLCGYREHRLQSLADAGAISQAWADYAADWYSTEETALTTYDERQYSLTVPYYSVDSLGLVTFKRFAVQNGVPTTLDGPENGQPHRAGVFFLGCPPRRILPPPTTRSLWPKEAALRAFGRPGRADQPGGLDLAGGPDLPPGHLQPERTGAGGRCVGRLHRQ